MQISVRGYRRIDRADLNIAPIALVAGQNGAGKTSLFQAVAAALAKSTRPMGIKKADAGLLVHRGADVGSVRVTTDGGYVNIAWPACHGDYEGVNPPAASAFAAGLSSILDMKPEERAKALADYVDAAPTIKDLYDAMNDAGFTDDAARKTWDTIEKEGWDAVHKKTADHGAGLKGQWEAVTGERYGAAKAAEWRPEGWSDELAGADLSAIESEIAEARATLEKTIAGAAVSADEIERLRKEAKGGDQNGVDAYTAAVAAAREMLEKAEAERDALPPADGGDGIPCPACGKHLVADYAWKDRTRRPEMTALKVAEDVGPAEMKARRQALASADGAVENKRASLSTAEKMLAEATARTEAAAKAQARLTEIENAPPRVGPSADDVAAARAALASAETAHAAATAKTRADKIHGNIQRNALLIDILSADGLRRKKLGKAVETFNGQLAALCAVAKWPAVRLDETLDAHFGAEPFWNCSEAQQMRVRTTLQIAQAVADKSAAVLIDRADMLDQGGRNGLFMMLRKAAVPALVLMKADTPDKLPDLRKAKMGTTYWLDGGTLAEVGAAELRAAA